MSGDMNARFLVSTRKGLFVAGKTSSGWWLREGGFLGDPVTISLADVRTGSWFAALNLGHFGVKLYKSTDEGNSWKECQAPRFPRFDSDTEQAEGPTVQLIWALEADERQDVAGLWAGTIPGALFHSADDGESWNLNTALWIRPEKKNWFGGGFDKPGIHSICVDPRDSEVVTLGISCGGVWRTRDGGKSWALCAEGMRAEYMPPDRQFDPNIQDPHRLVQCKSNPSVMWAQHHNGIFVTSDGAASWSEIQDVSPSGFGFAAAVHPEDSETAWFVPAKSDQARIPVEGQFVVLRTRDGGRSFEQLRRGLPSEQAYDIVFRHALDVHQSGSILAMGSTTGSLWVSEDSGDSWQNLTSHLPPIYSVRFI